MIPGMDPRMMKQAMKRMGMKQDDIDATEVIIRTPEKDIVFSSPSVAKLVMMGQESWQITGEYEEKSHDSKVEISEDDIQTVVAQTGKNSDVAKKAIEKHNGDLAAAILELTQ
ncbi:MAG: nascent polypeptide-associated complex protein [Nanoarchaeota archaeon]|nr:nascent polypeptide-associated complex protein [Nanoarchaeota archaeon]